MLKTFVLALVAAVLDAVSVPCGVPTVAPIEKNIVGGVDARPGSWPWVVLLVDEFGYIAGSGTIINNNIVVTSAQHFENWLWGLHDIDLPHWRVYAGEHDITLTDPNELYYRIRRVVVHPGYNVTSLRHDIALLIMADEIEYNDHTRPACLPDGAHLPTVGQLCYLPGWGGTRGTGNEEVLQQVDLPILDDEVCEGHFKGYIRDTEMCAGYENERKDFCGDDIGSPLMCKDAESGVWYAQGIASSGGNCTIADEPGVFEDLSTYIEWILSTMESAGYPYEY